VNRKAEWLDLPVIFDYSVDGGSVIIEDVTGPTMADIDARIEKERERINESLLEDSRER
jgi:flagellar biosynthesis/type III secretory pathway protein FliH